MQQIVKWLVKNQWRGMEVDLLKIRGKFGDDPKKISKNWISPR